MLEIKNVSKSYGNKKVLDNVSLKIKKEKYLVLSEKMVQGKQL